ncbi:MAG TPA: multiheme c-type cytochrome, partial [Labilithrix sp.]|nr:multiheme c-type cytochrome [Labilithrix sp.]
MRTRCFAHLALVALIVASAAAACTEPPRDQLRASVPLPSSPSADGGAVAAGSDEEPLPAPPSDAGPPPPRLPTSAFQSATVCAGCHTSIATQWSASMHSRSLTSPLMIAETNQGVRGPYAGEPNPDPKRFCVNCHSPSAARVTTSASLPLGDDSTLWKEGINCQTCHQFNGPPTSGGGGYSTGYMKGLEPGNTVFGPLENPSPSAPHQSGRSEGFDRA